jgi:hypothetical protein
MRNRILYIFTLLVCIAASAQRLPFNGTVLSGANPVEGILIVNLNDEKEVRSAKDGSFALQVQPGDVLAIADSRIKEYRITLTADMIAAQPYSIYVNLLEVQLDEVIITGFNMATILGIPVGNAYSPAERRLKNATSMAPPLNPQLIGGFMVDPIINMFTGKTKALKKNLAVEKKYISIDGLSAYFNDDILISEFNIPKDYVQGFKFFLADDKHFTTVLHGGNIKTIGYLLSEKAMEYLSLLAEEKE